MTGHFPRDGAVAKSGQWQPEGECFLVVKSPGSIGLAYLARPLATAIGF